MQFEDKLYSFKNKGIQVVIKYIKKCSTSSVIRKIIMRYYSIPTSMLGIKKMKGDFLGGSVVKTPCFHCRRHGCNCWLGN